MEDHSYVFLKGGGAFSRMLHVPIPILNDGGTRHIDGPVDRDGRFRDRGVHQHARLRCIGLTADRSPSMTSRK